MVQPTSLDAIGRKHGTDKSSLHHNYLSLYETFFAPLRDRELTLMEIGVFHGASLRTWEEYFPKAKIIGVDIQLASKVHERGRITIALADQSNIEELTRVAVSHGPFDIIVEDGSHMWEHQITSLRTLFPFLKNDGFYIIEDLQTNYGSMQVDYNGVAVATCVEYLKAWVDLRVADDQIGIHEVEDAFLRTYGRSIEFIAFCRRACLIKKRVLPPAQDGYAGQPLVAQDADGRSQAVFVLAHVANVGDVLGQAGFVNSESDGNALQGFAINSKSNLVEYRVRFPDGSWSAWTQEPSLAGTRGKSISLTGFTIRLLEHAKQYYTLCAFGRFAESADPKRVVDGQDCVSSSEGKALCGIQLELTRRLG